MESQDTQFDQEFDKYSREWDHILENEMSDSKFQITESKKKMITLSKLCYFLCVKELNDIHFKTKIHRSELLEELNKEMHEKLFMYFPKITRDLSPIGKIKK